MARGEKKGRSTASDGPSGAEGGREAEPEVLGVTLPVEQYLAAIVAHELSNPFTALSGRVDLMRSRKDVPAAVSRDLDAMKSANERIDRILANLKRFSRRETLPPRTLDLAPIVEAAMEDFRTSPRGSRVEVSLQPPERPVRALVDPIQLQRVVAACLESLSGRSRSIASIELRLSAHAPDEEAFIMFVDRGPSIAEEDIARVFHPFSGDELSQWGGIITMAYSYYIIRAWGGTFRFRYEGRNMITELCLVSHA